MTTTITTQDPVQGLVDYVLDVKPFHTKILEVWVEYIYNDPINASIKDKLDWEIHIDFDRINGCKYGWDTSPWDMFWNVKSKDEIATGNFTYKEPQGTTPETYVNKTIAKYDAYQLFFKYLTAEWHARNGDAIAPTINDTSTSNPFRILFMVNVLTSAQIIADCTAYWPTVDPTDYWFEPTLKRLYVFQHNLWVEQPFFYSSIRPELQTPPQSPQPGDYWFDTNTSKLYFNMRAGWSEIYKFKISPVMPPRPSSYPQQPDTWMSNWDYPPCTGPMGENHVYARVNDFLSFEHGSEIFLFDTVRAAVADPRGYNATLDDYAQYNISQEQPTVKWRTSVIQTSRNRYKMTREEISTITDPSNAELANTTWTIDLNDYDFDGWDIERTRIDVKLGTFLTWKHTDAGTKLLHDNLINDKTFRLRATTSGNLVAQRTTDTTVADIACPWVDGTIVYVRSTDDLPSFNPPTVGSPTHLERYRPYRIVKKTGNEFSLAFADPKTLAFDSQLMGAQTSLAFVTSGSGRLYVGIGYPVPFIEVHQHLTDAINAKKTKEVLASPMEVFEGFSPAQILDIAINYTGADGTSYTGFVADGNFIGHKKGSQIQVGGSPAKANDGLWTVDKVNVYTNMFASFDANGVGTPATKPVWWNTSKLGAWPLPVKKRQSEIDAMVASGSYTGFGSAYTYATFSLIAVSNGIPEVTVKPHGFIAEPSYNFNEGSGPNAAHTTVADKLIFGSLRAILQPDGTTKFEVEPGVPGVSIVLKDRIKATFQEGLNRNDPYGGQTIGSYDTPFYGQDTYDENLDTVIQRLGSQ